MSRLPKDPRMKIRGNPRKLLQDSRSKKVPEVNIGRHAVLNENGDPIAAGLLEWAAWFERSGQRFIAFDEIKDHTVSTVFTGLDMNLNPFHLRPLWFETMVFGPAEDKEMFGRMTKIRPDLWSWRTETKWEALEAHEKGKQWLAKYLKEKIKT